VFRAGLLIAFLLQALVATQVIFAKSVSFTELSQYKKSFIGNPSQGRKALIYKGEGSCIEDCSESAALMAQMAGLIPVYVSPKEVNPDIFIGASVWVQPGGESLIVSENMAVQLRMLIKRFVMNGGGYVGFCAGAFFADQWIHGTTQEGLGLLPGLALSYERTTEKAVMLDFLWNGEKRSIYWEEGPYLQLLTTGTMFMPFAYYPTGEIASAYGDFYQGRVILTGVHPEAPQYWRDDIKAADPDGLDYDLAVDMIRWAAGPHL
jgi:hypothetical protein